MKVPEKPDGKLVHTMEINPPWGHMDALGHINNTRYFAYCEQCRIEWLEKIGRISDISGRNPLGPVIIHAECTFVKQGIYPCPFNVLLYVGNAGRSSFMTWYEIRGQGDDVLYAVGSAKMVWVDYKREISVPLPQELRDFF